VFRSNPDPNKSDHRAKARGEGRLDQTKTSDLGVRVQAAGGDLGVKGDHDAAHSAAQGGAHAVRQGGQKEVHAQALHGHQARDRQLPGRGGAGQRLRDLCPALRLQQGVPKVEAARADRQRPQRARDFRLNDLKLLTVQVNRCACLLKKFIRTSFQ